MSTNQELIAQLGLQRHPEGGYYVETDRRLEQVPTPFVDGTPSRSLATSIYYLLAYDNPHGFIHMNKSVTYHVLHQGRAEYTLIHPGNPPVIENKIMGTREGEQRLLIVGTGVWKMSRLLPKDVESAETQEQKDRTGCLITEVVVPGFHWEDHEFLTLSGLKEIFQGAENGAKMIEELTKYTKG